MSRNNPLLTNQALHLNPKGKKCYEKNKSYQAAKAHGPKAVGRFL
jgi:hypothetical protein